MNCKLCDKPHANKTFCSHFCRNTFFSINPILPKGGTPWNKGNTRRCNTGRTHFKKDHQANLGIKRPPISNETRKKLTGRTGSKSPHWKGGITPINSAIRTSVQYLNWRKHVFNRDDYTCQVCGHRGGKLQVDHELSFSNFPALRFEILNGRVLCLPCHKKTPNFAGRAKQNAYDPR